jgi:hypothetical protein
VSLYEELFVKLAEVRYVVVGGLAVVLHGHARLTADIDLIIDLTPAEAEKAISALEATGLRPRAPVRGVEFADAEKRRQWIERKGMRVFSLWDPKNPLREVDLFVEPPIPFEELYARAELLVIGRASIRVASIPDLISLKRMAGRPSDLADIEALEALLALRTR